MDTSFTDLLDNLVRLLDPLGPDVHGGDGGDEDRLGVLEAVLPVLGAVGRVVGEEGAQHAPDQVVLEDATSSS